MPNGDGTGPAWSSGMGFGCGRRLGRGMGGGKCLRTLSVEERRKLLEQRKAEIEAEIKALGSSEAGKTE